MSGTREMADREVSTEWTEREQILICCVGWLRFNSQPLSVLTVE